MRVADPKPLTGSTLAGCCVASVVAMIYAGIALARHDYPVIIRVLLIVLFPVVLAGDVVLLMAYRRSRPERGE